MRGKVEVIERVQSVRATRDEADEYRAFSFGRVGIKPQMTLLVRKSSGEVEGFPYSDFTGIWSLNEDDGFTIRFRDRIINIEGRNLRRLFDYICNHRAAEIVEIDSHAAMAVADESAVVWRVSMA